MKIQSIIPLGITSAVVLSFAASAIAQDESDKPKRPQRQAYEDIDKDGNGISFEEFLKAQEERVKRVFERLDSNKDGTVSKEEWDSKGNRRPMRQKGDNDSSGEPVAE